MTDRKSSAAMAATASRVMEIAKRGGPIQHFKAELQEKFADIPVLKLDFLDRIDSVLRSYIDDAESLAASVLSQRKP
jgi:hypothetical protein